MWGVQRFCMKSVKVYIDKNVWNICFSIHSLTSHGNKLQLYNKQYDIANFVRLLMLIFVWKNEALSIKLIIIDILY